MRQKGFATLEVILMVMVIGILASIAVPRFTSVTTAANTAKIQADLTTIDTAIAVYIMENGTPTSAPALSDLDNYLQDATNLKPPTGQQAYITGTPTAITGSSYLIQDKGSGNVKNYRATLDGHTAGEFTKNSTSNNNPTTPTT